MLLEKSGSDGVCRDRAAVGRLPVLQYIFAIWTRISRCFPPQYSSEPLAIHEFQLLSLDLEPADGGGAADPGAGTDSSSGPFPEL